MRRAEEQTSSWDSMLQNYGELHNDIYPGIVSSNSGYPCQSDSGMMSSNMMSSALSSSNLKADLLSAHAGRYGNNRYNQQVMSSLRSMRHVRPSSMNMYPGENGRGNLENASYEQKLLRFELKMSEVTEELDRYKEKFRILEDLVFSIIESDQFAAGVHSRVPSHARSLRDYTKSCMPRGSVGQMQSWQNNGSISGDVKTGSSDISVNRLKQLQRAMDTFATPQSTNGRKNNHTDKKERNKFPTANKKSNKTKNGEGKGKKNGITCKLCLEGMAWECVECHNINFPWRKYCNMRKCQVAKPARHNHHEVNLEDMSSSNTAPTHMKMKMKNQRKKMFESKKSLAVAAKWNMKIPHREPQPTEISHQILKNNPNLLDKVNTADNCQMCAAGFSWECKKCRNWNYGWRQVCNLRACKAPKMPDHSHCTDTDSVTKMKNNKKMAQKHNHKQQASSYTGSGSGSGSGSDENGSGTVTTATTNNQQTNSEAQTSMSSGSRNHEMSSGTETNEDDRGEAQNGNCMYNHGHTEKRAHSTGKNSKSSNDRYDMMIKNMNPESKQFAKLSYNSK